MTDHAQVVREVLNHACWLPGTPNPHAALDALVAERDEAQRRHNRGEQQVAGMLTQLTAVVAERDEARDALMTENLTELRLGATGSLFSAERCERLIHAITERAEQLERDARDADDSSASYRGHDVEASVDLARSANRARSRAAELRLLLDV